MLFLPAFALSLPLQHSIRLPSLRVSTCHQLVVPPSSMRRRVRPTTPVYTIYTPPACSAAASTPSNVSSTGSATSSSKSRPLLRSPSPLPSRPLPKNKLPPSTAAQTLSLLLQRLSQYSKTEPFIRTHLILAIFFMLTSKVVSISVPLLFKRTIDALSAGIATIKPATSATVFSRITSILTSVNFQPVAILLIAYCAARLISDVCYELRTAVFAKAGQRLGRRVTRHAFTTLHTLGASWHAGIASGAVSRTVDRGTRSILVIFRALVFGFIPSLFELTLVLGVMASKQWYMGMSIVFVMFITFVSWTLIINNVLGQRRISMNALDTEASARLTDSLINYEVVSTFNNANFERKRYDTCLETFEKTSIRNEWEFALLNTGQKFIFTVGLTLVFFLTAADIMTGRRTVGDMAMIAMMLRTLWVPLNYMGWQYRELIQSLIDLQNLFDLVETKPTVVDARGATKLNVMNGAIVFDNVSFSYPQRVASKSSSVFAKDSYITVDQDANGHGGDGRYVTNKNDGTVIRNLSFRVPPGKTFALVGASGSGKSTALRLLYRLYDIDSGRILIDGQDVSKVTLSSLREAVAMVPQDTVLFNDTIAYNIGYGRPDASMEEIIAAAKAASIHEVIMKMKDGYSTMCGERGVRLSGGERQRMSAARAFLKGSKIVLQDEATSALDSKTEAEVTKALKTLGKNRTSLVVAHRLSTIFDADWIIVMSKGVIVEEGTHQSLLKVQNGVYKAMWERQQDPGYQVDGEVAALSSHEIDCNGTGLDKPIDDKDSATVDGRCYKDELSRKYC